MRKINFEVEVEFTLKGATPEQLMEDDDYFYLKSRSMKADIEDFSWSSDKQIGPDRYSAKLDVLARTDSDLDFDKWVKNLKLKAESPVKMGSSKVVGYKVTDVR